MRASEFVIEPGTKLLGKLASTGKIVQVKIGRAHG